MRFERRICDLCGHRSTEQRTKEPPGDMVRSTLLPVKTFEQMGWDTVADGSLDRCASCAWDDRVLKVAATGEGTSS